MLTLRNGLRHGTARAVVARLAALIALPIVSVPAAAGTEITLPPGFTSQGYVTGEGFDRGGAAGAPGIPVATSLGFDRAGVLYLAKSGDRYGPGQAESFLSRLYRVPPGGTRITTDTEARYLHGPPLRAPEVGAAGAAGEVFVTAYDPERQVGVLYRVKDGRPVLFAGGTPPKGSPPLLAQPEGVALDAAGNVYVADRVRGVVVKLDPTGRVLDAHYEGLSVARARMLAIDPAGHLWVAGDGSAERPWQDGVGQIWRVGPEERPRLVFEGPHAAAIAAGPGGTLFVAQRHAAKIFAVTPDGRRLDFAGFSGDAAPRSLAFAPVTPETERAGIAGDLFVVSFALRTWYLNEVIRISGPFADFVRQGRGTITP